MSAGRRVLYLNPMTYQTNPGVDAIAHGLQHRLAGAGVELRVVWADFATPDWLAVSERAIDAALAQRFDAVIVYVLDPEQPAAAVARASAAGTPVFSFEKPHFPVAGSIVYPNFNHGVYLAEHLAAHLPAGARIAIVGGPKIIDDDELVAGIIHGTDHSGLTRVNDPIEDRYRNQTDLRPGGREAAHRVLADHPDVVGIIPFNDETMLGTLDALEELGRSDLKPVSRNGTPKAVEALRLGRTLGTWDIDAPGIGAAMADLVLRHLDGGGRAGELALGPIGRMIDASNVADWTPWSARIPYDELHEGLD
jgi:ABC-type sugar transport system substrate-binding protein